ncbi:hypothetical protein M433DRAFT_158677 [Acidomyces richmondensis BFW]|nr:MAG: hypothetical protein FE78DRAFT_86090 [Acidomyces sp. 'richmondensis']KYG41761.1 hypothetical protein M433DRAFT_158677 [Acidomyces richmondensis BFW]
MDLSCSHITEEKVDGAISTMEKQERALDSRLMNLPAELREQIYLLLVVKPQNTVTMLSNYNCYRSEVSACQPTISFVSRQLRKETLPLFYGNNLFMAEITQIVDLEIAKRWLNAIGDENVKSLRRLAICGWTRIPFGHMVSKRWVRIVLDLKNGTIEVEGTGSEAGQYSSTIAAIEQLKASFLKMVESRDGLNFDVESLETFLDGFHGLCAVY